MSSTSCGWPGMSLNPISMRPEHHPRQIEWLARHDDAMSINAALTRVNSSRLFDTSGGAAGAGQIGRFPGRGSEPVVRGGAEESRFRGVDAHQLTSAVQG